MVWGYKNERVKSFRALRKPHASLVLQHDGFYFYFFSFNEYFLFFNAKSITPLTFMYNNILPRDFLALVALADVLHEKNLFSAPLFPTCDKNGGKMFGNV